MRSHQSPAHAGIVFLLLPHELLAAAFALVVVRLAERQDHSATQLQRGVRLVGDRRSDQRRAVGARLSGVHGRACDLRAHAARGRQARQSDDVLLCGGGRRGAETTGTTRWCVERAVAAFPDAARIIPWSRGAIAKPGGNAFVARRGLSVHSTRVGRPQPALAFATEAAQRLDIPLVLVDGGGKDRPSTQLALLAQRGLVEFQLFLDGFDPLLVRR